jgi:hypothetical protein
MGGRRFQCEACREVTTLYNSCGDRDCPECSGGKRADFHDHAAKRIIDGVVYYQVTMTLPTELSELALSNRQLFAELLPRAAWSSLNRCIESEQGYRAGAISVLHTWNQKLENHWHVHLLVPGAGPSIDGGQWHEATPPPECGNDNRFYLVDADRLRAKFRGGFIRRLKGALRSGRLKLTGRFAYLKDADNWSVFQKQLQAKTWVAHIQPPPTKESLADHVVNYLTRYVTGGPISNRRIVSADIRNVTFMAREGQRVGGERQQVPITMSTAEFTQRWCQHIQPMGLTKVRYFGSLSNNKVSDYMALCKQLHSPSLPINPSEDLPPDSDIICAHCGSDQLVWVSSDSKPSWRDLLGYHSETAPWWYAAAREQDDRAFWDGAMGSGFNDWYLETFVVSAKENGGQESQPIQLDLPGFEQFATGNSYPLNSF